MLVEGFVEPVLAELPIGLADEVRTRLRAALGASPSLFDHPEVDKFLISQLFAASFRSCRPQ